MPRWLRVGMQMVLAVGASAAFVLVGGCGSSTEDSVCDATGCYVCDGYGCRPADPQAGTGGSTAAPDASDGSAACDSALMTCPCDESGGCADGLSCIDNLCLSPCEFSSECGGGRICANGKCVVGCDESTACPDGYTCSEKGTCIIDTVSGCSDAVPCTGGLKCVDGACVGTCESHDDCALEEICNASTGTCIPDPQPSKPCEHDPSVCSAQQVCSGGYCRYACDAGTSCKLIDARIPVCKDGICMSEAEANPQCTKKEECLPSQDCVSNVCL